ncbi:hypothetical protein [Candidatus Rhabdochlamydia porcellionis]|jgi:hypothetical protein|uniref:Uncharacterized protein n=1 Tax=Candidatus Rhabdochlamydia porcellionis TaxID=225148 RepID=A0ABX8Z4H6_9BACT|nr:hypothetical protein [Candidatus Rhabdochlamydia porcellionis]QZA59208.1 hypothetical protein RHAB15C_0001093 [Candidatus Rhabdochlamydia porcellionis]
MIEKIQTNSVRIDGILPSSDLKSKDSSASELRNKKHKGMLPTDAIRLNYVEKGEESLLKEKVKAILTEVKTAIKKSGFDPRVTNILMLYIAFAQNQMDQNDKLEAGWMDQQHVQNLLLEDSAKEQKKIANESTQGRHANIGAIIGFSLLAIIGFALLFTGIGTAAGAGLLATEGAFAAGGAVAAASGTAVAGAGAFAGTGVSLGFAVPAMTNPEGAGLGPVTQEGPDQAKLAKISILNSFWNLLAQKANQNIQTGTQLNIVNTSSSNTQQGQQASQIISEWGQMSRFQVAR